MARYSTHTMAHTKGSEAMKQCAKKFRVKVYRRKEYQAGQWRYVAVMGQVLFEDEYVIAASEALEDLPGMIEAGDICLMTAKELEAMTEDEPIAVLVYKEPGKDIQYA